MTPVQNWPLLKAQQAQQIREVRAGNLQIVDRKSWQFPYLPASVQRLSMPVAKSSPYNLRRFGRTPIARRAINLIKNSITSQPWDVRPIENAGEDTADDREWRIRVAKSCLRHPNKVDSVQSWLEQGIEDMCTLGAFASEIRMTVDPERPFKLWCVDVSTVRIFVSWSESTPDLPHYAQMTGLQGERGAILFYDDEMLYIRDNPATDNPFGLGKLEVSFQSLNDLLGVQRMAGMAGADTVHKSWLWWEQPQTDAAYQIVRRHIQNELEGQAKVSIIGGMKKPDVLEIQPVQIEDLLLPWQEMLIRVVANGFDISAMALNITNDVNRAVGQVLDDKDFRSAVVPMAKRLQEGITRKIIHERLGWYDLEFVFLNLDDPDLETKTDMYARMYSGNALVPNEWREGMGMQPLDSVFADLTQFEAMMLNMELMAKLQSGAFGGGQQQQGQMGPGGGQGGQRQGGGYGGGGGVAPVSQGGIARGGQVESPRPLMLPKFPVAGSKWNAKQIAQMPVNDLSDRVNGGELPEPKKLLRDMTAQDPTILDQMSDEVRQYFEDRLNEQEKEEKGEDAEPKDLKKWVKVLRKKVSEQNKRNDSMTDYLTDIARKRGQMRNAKLGRNATPSGGMGSPRRAIRAPGKPGQPPPARGL